MHKCSKKKNKTAKEKRKKKQKKRERERSVILYKNEVKHVMLI